MNNYLTIKDIARISGVGISTVSRVLNNRPDVSQATRKKVMDVVTNCNYTPNGNAKHLKQKTTDYIIAIVAGTQNMFLSSIIENLQQYVEENGFSFLPNYIDENADIFLAAQKLQAERKAQGIIFVGGDGKNKESEITKLGVPCVFATYCAKGILLDNVLSVSVDDVNGAFNAVNYLIENGHTDILVLGGKLESQNTVGLRYKGVCNAFIKHNLTFNADNYIPCHFTFNSAYKAIKNALNTNKKFTAIFATSDIMAVGAAKALTENGKKIPEDVSIIGFDGTEFAKFYTPTLATISQPSEQIAKISVELLNDYLTKKNNIRHVTLPTLLQFGGSVKKID